MTEQYYLRARYYNPTIARFTQEDVYRGDGLNLYAFCANNAVMYVDPSGYAGENLERITWNEFQSINQGRYDNAGMSTAWSEYKGYNGMEHYLNRPYLTKDTINGIQIGRNADGTFYDANTLEIITGQVDIGHVAGKEFWRCRDAAEALGWTQSQFNEYMNNSSFYQFEAHEENISHQYESKSKDIDVEMQHMKNFQKEKEVKRKCAIM